MQQLPDMLVLKAQTENSPQGARTADRRLVRAIGASRSAIEHSRATCARMDRDLECGTVPPMELDTHRSLRAHLAESLMQLERTIADECAQLDALRGFKRELTAAKRPEPNPDHARQAAYRARNREKVAQLARERRALARMLS